MIKIVTDSSSDISQEEAKKLGVVVIPLSINFEDASYLDEVEISADEFYKKLTTSKRVPTTSQVSPGIFEELFAEAKAKGDTLIVMPLSSKISGTYNCANMIKNQGGYDNVYVYDSLATINLLKLLVIIANENKDKMEPQQLIDYVESIRQKVKLYAVIDTLEYLQKGGRLSKTSAVIGSLLKVKPMIGVIEGEVKLIGKQIGTKKCFDWIKTQIKQNPIDYDFPVYFQYSGNNNKACEFIDSLEFSEENKQKYKSNLRGIGPVVGTHIGPGAAAIIYVSKQNN